MIKVEFKELKDNPPVSRTFYSSINPIPFSVTIGNYPSLPTTIYARNISGQNFIEFRFDKNYDRLYEITLVGIQNDTIGNQYSDRIIDRDDVFFRCIICEKDSILDGASPMKIVRSKNAVSIDWVKTGQTGIRYFCIGRGCYIGVDDESIMSSVLLTGLSEEEMFDVFGF